MARGDPEDARQASSHPLEDAERGGHQCSGGHIHLSGHGILQTERPLPPTGRTGAIHPTGVPVGDGDAAVTLPVLLLLSEPRAVGKSAFPEPAPVSLGAPLRRLLARMDRVRHQAVDEPDVPEAVGTERVRQRTGADLGAPQDRGAVRPAELLLQPTGRTHVSGADESDASGDDGRGVQRDVTAAPRQTVRGERP